MQFDQYVFYFVIYAMIGYISEVVYCSVPMRRLVNRGFLHGPYLPIYGFGALLIIIPLLFFTAHPILVFFIAFFLTSALEYATSFVLEKIFHTQLWDYSQKFANIHGRVCLLNSTLFGLMGVAAIYWIHPAITAFVQDIPEYVLNPVSTVLLLVIAIDTTISIFSLNTFQRQLVEFRLKVKELELRFELLAKEKSNPSLERLKVRLNRELEDRRIKLNKRSRRILDAFPSITAKNEEQRLQLELLKMEFRSYREKKKNQRSQRKKNNQRKQR